MDLNELLYHHQIALMSVSEAQRGGDAVPCFDLPLYYAKRINEYRERRGLAGDVVVVGRPWDMAAPRSATAPGRYAGDMLPVHQPAILA